MLRYWPARSVLPDLITKLTAIIGVAGMIYGVATGMHIVLDREPQTSEGTGTAARW
ncbi:MAG TPA: hypothetical protein VHR39_17015 [Propionibacteriaceae bacterium]|nr:hypothetical protein [Propionibacteriaceae bacterium]